MFSTQNELRNSVVLNISFIISANKAVSNEEFVMDLLCMVFLG